MFDGEKHVLFLWAIFWTGILSLCQPDNERETLSVEFKLELDYSARPEYPAGVKNRCQPNLNQISGLLCSFFSFLFFLFVVSLDGFEKLNIDMSR